MNRNYFESPIPPISLHALDQPLVTELWRQGRLLLLSTRANHLNALCELFEHIPDDIGKELSNIYSEVTKLTSGTPSA